MPLLYIEKALVIKQLDDRQIWTMLSGANILLKVLRKIPSAIKSF